MGEKKASSDDRSLQVVIVEASASLWANKGAEAPSLAPGQLVGALSCYLRAFFSLNRENAALIIGVNGAGTKRLFDSRGGGGAGGIQGSPEREIREGMAALLEEDQVQNPLPLSASLSQALCACHREGETHLEKEMARAKGTRQQKVLCLMGSPDPPEQYVPIMNCLFSAQRLGVRIDTLRLSERESSFLQQAAHLTEGAYSRWARAAKSSNLLQLMLSLFAPDPSSGAKLRMPPPPGVDFRASCFCHQRPVDIGRVCSACLSIFCSDVGSCSTCGAVFSEGLGPPLE